MPPRTLTSAVVLVSLASLTAIEAGGCSKRTESLRSVTRAGLPLLAQAIGPVSAEASYSLADYGVRPIPGLKYVCGHYELGPEGQLITRDLFSATMPPKLLEQAVGNAQSATGRTLARSRSVSLKVSEYTAQRLPKSCRKVAMDQSRSLLVASRQL